MRISDWSSDVCSSDLLVDRADHRADLHVGTLFRDDRGQHAGDRCGHLDRDLVRLDLDQRLVDLDAVADRLEPAGARAQTGRASCRESGCRYGWISVVAVSLKKKTTEQRDITVR